MSLHVVRLADVAPQPWRNGGGATRELLAWPQAEGWTLRISVAEIAADGPFSAFPGIDRWFAVLSGAGVRLALPGGERLLRTGDEALSFDGGDAPGCRLIDGPTQDLNLMWRRGPGGATMRRFLPGDVPARGARWRAFFAGGTLTWSDDPDADALPAALLGPAWLMELLP